MSSRSEGQWGEGQRRHPRAGLQGPNWNILLLKAAVEMFQEVKHAKHAPPKDDNIKDGTEDANHNGRMEGDNGDGKFRDREYWKETSPISWEMHHNSIRDNKEIIYGYDPLCDEMIWVLEIQADW